MGMTLAMGQPPPVPAFVAEQNGSPQSMQRAVCCLSSASDRRVEISFQSLTRLRGGRYASLRRLYFMKPRTLSSLAARALYASSSSIVSSMSSTAGSRRGELGVVCGVSASEAAMAAFTRSRAIAPGSTGSTPGVARSTCDAVVLGIRSMWLCFFFSSSAAAACSSSTRL